MIEGDAVWKAGEDGRWSKELLTAPRFRAATIPWERASRRRRPHAGYGGVGPLPKIVKNPAAYFIEYRDGLKATLLMLDGAVKDFNFAARVEGNAGHQSTQFFLSPEPNVTYSACLGQNRADVRNRRCALSDGADAAGERHSGKLPDLESAESREAGNAAPEGGVPGARRIGVLSSLGVAGRLT